jgi:hypothetical protein
MMPKVLFKNIIGTLSPFSVDLTFCIVNNLWNILALNSAKENKIKEGQNKSKKCRTTWPDVT